MKSHLFKLFSVFVCFIVFFGVRVKAFAFDISPTKSPDIGQEVYLVGAQPSPYHYAIFGIDVQGYAADACAYITGDDLITDNNLTHYGTCFVNDKGTFQVLELSDDFLGTLQDTQQSTVFVSKTNLVVQNHNFFIPGIPDMTSATDSGISQSDNITNNTAPAFSVSCISGYIVKLFSDSQQIATDTCPTAATVNLSSQSILSSDLHFFTAKQTDSSGNQSIASDGLVATIDAIPPVITGIGLSPVSIKRGSSYLDAGATALDNIDGDISANIITVNPVNTSVLGTSTVTYSVSDTAGNLAVQVVRIIKVVIDAVHGTSWQEVSDF